MKIKLFCILSTLFTAIALLMPVSVYAADHAVNVTPVVEKNSLKLKPCLTLSSDMTFSSDSTFSSGITVDGDGSAAKFDVVGTDAQCDDAGGFIQFNVSWNS